MVLKIIEAMRWGEAQLLEKGIENARFDADVLLAEILGLSRERLYLEVDSSLSGRNEEDYQKVIRRRAAHEPLQYILKRQEFMGLSFYVDERVLIPRPDSEPLVEKWLDIIRQEEYPRRNSPLRVADICTGSGALAISMAYHCPGTEVVGADISAAALEVARQNALQLGVSVQWRQGDFIEPIRGELWDFIVTNPPYVSAAGYGKCAPEIYREPTLAFLGGQDGLDFYRRLAEEARSLLNHQGRLLMEIGWDQGEAVSMLFRQKGFTAQIFPDLAGRNRVILAR